MPSLKSPLPLHSSSPAPSQLPEFSRYFCLVAAPRDLGTFTSLVPGVLGQESQPHQHRESRTSPGSASSGLSHAKGFGRILGLSVSFLNAENEEALKNLLFILKAKIPLEFNLPVMDLILLQTGEFFLYHGGAGNSLKQDFVANRVFVPEALSQRCLELWVTAWPGRGGPTGHIPARRSRCGSLGCTVTPQSAWWHLGVHARHRHCQDQTFVLPNSPGIPVFPARWVMLQAQQMQHQHRRAPRAVLDV